MSYQLIKLADASKSFGPQSIFENISFIINKGNRVALIGENGSGKTTLAKIILGLEPLDEGSIEISPSIEIGYLPQEMDFENSKAVTVQDYLLEAQNQLKSRIERKREIEEELSKELSPEMQNSLMQEWNDCHDAIERRGGYAWEHRMDEVLEGLGLTHMGAAFPLSRLSGGQKTRVGLAGLLLSNPDVLILDEPTNHLDLSSLEWLEKYLLNYSGALLLISHDRLFINRIVNRIVELSRHTRQLSLYGGNYDFFLEEKKKALERTLKEYEERKEEIQSLKQLISAKTFAKPKQRAPSDRNIMAYDRRGERHMQSESRSIQQAKLKLEKLQREPLNHPIPKSYKGIRFQPDELRSDHAIEFQNISKQYPELCLFKDAEGSLSHGERVVLMGPNGSGKSTFLKILMGLISLDDGEVKIAPNARVGYLDQELSTFERQASPVEIFGKAFGLSEADLRSELHKAGLLFDGAFDRKICELSLGQRKKLQILHLMLSRCNVLLLDEPSNHLDMATMDNFEEALKLFNGAVLAVTHDRWFIERIATQIWRLENGLLVKQCP